MSHPQDPEMKCPSCIDNALVTTDRQDVGIDRTSNVMLPEHTGNDVATR